MKRISEAANRRIGELANQRTTSWRAGALVFLVLLACYAYFFPRWAEWNQNSRMDLTMALVEQGTFVIDDYYENTGDYAVYGGHIYTDKAPGTSFLGVPAYFVFRRLAQLPPMERLLERLSNTAALKATLREGGTGLLREKVYFAAALYFVTFFTISLPSALLGVLLYLFLGRIVPNRMFCFLLVLGYGLATIVLPYSTVFYGHQLAAALLFLAFYLAYRVRHGESGPNVLWGVGALLGLTVLVEFPALPAAALLALYSGGIGSGRIRIGRTNGSLIRKFCTSVFRVLLAALPFALLLGFYNYSCFGSPFTSSYKYLGKFPEISGYGFLGFGPPRLEALWGVTFSPYRGLFFLSPFLVLALPGFLAWFRDREWRAEFFLVMSTVAVHFLLISCWYDWRGGFAIGPRNLLLILPYLALAVGFYLRAWGNSALGKGLFVALLAVSFVLVWIANTGGQLFPSITIANPLVEYHWPHFRAGDIARNLGMALGLPRWYSLLPLILLIGGSLWMHYRIANREWRMANHES